jgi:hypothetical protein
VAQEKITNGINEKNAKIMGTSVFPGKREGLHVYFEAVIQYLNDNATRLGISTSNLSQLNALYGDILTVGTYLYCWTIWTDRAGGRTRNVNSNLAIAEKQLQQQLSLIYNDIPATLWTQSDRNTLGRKTGLPRPHTVSADPIGHRCFASASPVGGGIVKVTCRYMEDQTRASKPEGADALEIAYSIRPVKFKQGAEYIGKVKDMMVDPDDGTIKFISTRSAFAFPAGVINAGMDFQFFARWINTRHASNAGPWTGPFSVIIA